MVQYFKEILNTFSTAQRIWALIILCVTLFLITFGSNIIESLKPDPIQQNLVVKRQKNQILTLNTQLDSLTIRVDDLTQEVIDGQAECTKRRLIREREIISQIDELISIINRKHNQMVVSSPTSINNDTISVVRDNIIYDDTSEKIVEGLISLRKKIKNKK
jgi:cell division protein FtsB